MRGNILLALGSTVCSVLLALYVARDIVWPKAPEGSTFQSIDQLRETISKRDERDVKPDKSVSLRSIIRPHPSDYIIYELAPNLDVKFQRVRVKTNSHGMRSPERPVVKPADTFRIVLLGDSYAFGWGVEQDKIFAEVLEEKLNEEVADPRSIEVLNFGVPGYSTFQQVSQFLEKGIAFEPDIVLVFFINNDFGLPFFIKNYNTPGKLLPSSQFKKMRQLQHDETQRKKTEEFLAAINANDNLQRLADVLAAKNIPLIVSMNPRRGSGHDENQLPILREHPNLHYHPIKEPYKAYVAQHGLKREELTLHGDPHPNARRHAIYGRLLADELKPYVTDNRE